MTLTKKRAYPPGVKTDVLNNIHIILHSPILLYSFTTAHFHLCQGTQCWGSQSFLGRTLTILIQGIFFIKPELQVTWWNSGFLVMVSKLRSCSANHGVLTDVKRMDSGVPDCLYLESHSHSCRQPLAWILSFITPIQRATRFPFASQNLLSFLAQMATHLLEAEHLNRDRRCSEVCSSSNLLNRQR